MSGATCSRCGKQDSSHCSECGACYPKDNMHAEYCSKRVDWCSPCGKSHKTGKHTKAWV